MDSALPALGEPAVEAEAKPRAAPMTICALLPQAETAAATLRGAAAAARGLAATVVAIPVGAGRPSTGDAPRQDDAELANIRSAFDAVVADHRDSPSMRWRNPAIDSGAQAFPSLGDADLAVVGRPSRLDHDDALHNALFDAHRLLLVVPPAPPAAGKSFARRVVIGWKPGPAIRQTAEAALPWLRRAEKITVLWMSKTGMEAYGHDARAFFTRAGLDADIVGLGKAGPSVGQQLLDEAHRRGGDCLVVGAFRRESIWRSLHGGVTRDILLHASLPVFMMRGL